METQERVVQGLRHEIQEPDLLLNGESSGTVVDLLTGDSYLLQKRLRLEPGASCPRPCEPRDAPRRSREGAESCGIDSIHGSHSINRCSLACRDNSLACDSKTSRYFTRINSLLKCTSSIARAGPARRGPPPSR